jgi:hypothetical protein
MTIRGKINQADPLAAGGERGLTDRARADLAELGIDPALATPRRHPHMARAVIAGAAAVALATGAVWGAGWLGGDAPASAVTINAHIDAVEQVVRNGVEGYLSTVTLTPQTEQAQAVLAEMAAQDGAAGSEGSSTLTVGSSDGDALSITMMDPANKDAGGPVTLEIFFKAADGAVGEPGEVQTLKYEVGPDGELSLVDGEGSAIASLVDISASGGALALTIRPSVAGEDGLVELTVVSGDSTSRIEVSDGAGSASMCSSDTPGDCDLENIPPIADLDGSGQDGSGGTSSGGTSSGDDSGTSWYIDGD